MAYADQEVSGNRIAAFVVVALLHLALGYALVTGLAYEGFKAVVKKVTAVDIKKEEKKEEKPPPPKKVEAPPPIVAPPPKININSVAPPVQVVTTPPPTTPVVPVIVPAPPSAPPAPPPKAQVKQGVPKGNPGNWVTNNDYPIRALREERSGVVSFRLTIGPDGVPAGCDITGSSGSPDLDSTTCALMMRRARFYPGLDADGKPTGATWASRMRWVIPQDEVVEIETHPVPGTSVIAFTIDKSGHAKNCLVVSGADPALFLNFVSPCEGEQHFPPYVDAQGNPVERRVRMTVGVTLSGTQPVAGLPRKKKRR